MAKKDKELIETGIVTLGQIERRVYSIRDQQVMLDSELARLYGVETRVLNQAVRRNVERFPDDFMFELTKEEFNNLKSQIVTSSSNNYGGRRKLPLVSTEQGVAMLSSVLNSERAVQVNIAIMRVFVNMRKLAESSEAIREKITSIEKKLGKHDNNFKAVFAAIKAMIAPPRGSRSIGFIVNNGSEKK